MIMMLIASVTVTLVGCSDDSRGTETPSSDKYSNIPEEELLIFESSIKINKLMRNEVVSSSEKNDVGLISTEVNSAIYLPKDHPQYDGYYRMLDVDGINPLQYTIRSSGGEKGFVLIRLEKLSPQKEKEIRDSWHTSTGSSKLIPFGDNTLSIGRKSDLDT